MFLSFIILLFYNATIFCSEFYFPLLTLHDDQLNTVLFFYAEPKKALVRNYNTREDEEKVVIGLDGIKKLKELRLVCKAFISYIDTLFKNFPLVCCDNLIIPCVPFEPKMPIAHIKLTAPNEYDINLKLYFKTSLEYVFSEKYVNGNDNLFLQWQYQITFNKNSCIKKILDNHCNEIMYNARSETCTPGSRRSCYFRAIQKIVADIQNEPHHAKHYFYFAKHFKNIGLPTRGPDHGVRFILKCFDKNLMVLGGNCYDTIFPSDAFIKSTFINIQVPNPLITFSLKALNDRASSYPGINPFLIQPILQEHIINLEQHIEKLKSNDYFSLLKIVQKCIKKINAIEGCFKKLSDPQVSEEKNIINSLNVNLHNAKDLFLNAFYKRLTPTTNNLVEIWLWKKTCASIEYIVKGNVSVITKEVIEKTRKRIFKIIKIVLDAHSSSKISTELEALACYVQKKIFNLHNKKLSSNTNEITVPDNENYWNKIRSFFTYEHLTEDYIFSGNFTERQRTMLAMTPYQCECTKMELEKKLQKQLQDKKDISKVEKSQEIKEEKIQHIKKDQELKKDKPSDNSMNFHEKRNFLLFRVIPFSIGLSIIMLICLILHKKNICKT